MVKTIIIAVCSAGAYFALVIALTAYFSYRLFMRRKRFAKALGRICFIRYILFDVLLILKGSEGSLFVNTFILPYLSSFVSLVNICKYFFVNNLNSLEMDTIRLNYCLNQSLKNGCNCPTFQQVEVAKHTCLLIILAALSY